MADLGFELLFRFMWGGVVLLTILSQRDELDSSRKFPVIVARTLGLCGLIAIACTYFSDLSRHRTAPALAALFIGVRLFGWGRSRLARVAGFSFWVSAPIFWLTGQSIDHVFNFLASSFLLGSAFAGIGLIERRASIVISTLSAALILRALQVAMTLFLAIGLNARTQVDAMGRPLTIDVGSTLALPQMSSAVAMLSLEGDSVFGLGSVGAMVLGTRVLWGLLGPWVLIYLLKRATRMQLTKLSRRILYTLSVMLLLGEGAALFLQATLGWPI